MAELNLLFLLNKIVSAEVRITAQSFHPSVSGVIKILMLFAKMLMII